MRIIIFIKPLRNSEAFDFRKLGRYAVIRVHFDLFNKEPAEEKLFIILCHKRTPKQYVCHCIKTTAEVEFYQRNPRRLAGAVFYKGRALPFFPKDTIIDPTNNHEIAHQFFERKADKGQYRIEGKMPDDFHRKLMAAIKQSYNLEPKAQNYLLESIGERSRKMQAAAAPWPSQSGNN